MLWRDIPGCRRPRGPVHRLLALLVGGVWGWATFRLFAQPGGRVGMVEGLVAAGGWGLSLLPVHCVPRPARRERRRGARR